MIPRSGADFVFSFNGSRRNSKGRVVTAKKTFEIGTQSLLVDHVIERVSIRIA
jgi:hypothetical protein